MITKIDTPKDCASEADDVAYIDTFIDSLSGNDIDQLIGDRIEREPIKPFKPIR